MTELREYLESLFGTENVCGKTVPDAVMLSACKDSLYESYSIYDRQYVFIHWTDGMSLHQYEVRRPAIERALGLPLIMVLNSAKASQMRTLLNRRIMFIAPGRQIYMPSCGLVIKTTRKTMPKAKVTKFTPQMQLCALFFLYADESAHSVKEIVAVTKLNEMAVSRGIAVLISLEAIKAERAQKGAGYRICGDKGEFYRRVGSLLCSPVREEVLIKEQDLPESCAIAGYTALCKWSDLADDDRNTYAVSSKAYAGIRDKVKPETDTLIYDDNYVCLQVWKYSPVLYADVNGYVDKISLWLSIPDKDARTEAAINSLMNEVIGWHPPVEDY